LLGGVETRLASTVLQEQRHMDISTVVSGASFSLVVGLVAKWLKDRDFDFYLRVRSKRRPS
jgi:hypothetical protein